MNQGPSAATAPGPTAQESPDLADLADLVAGAAAAVPGVARVADGTGVATLLPGRRVEGVRLRDGSTEVHIVLCWGSVADDVAAAVRRVVEPLSGGRVDVVVADLEGP